MAGRTFIVRVSDAPHRVVVEDVRNQRSVVAPDLGGVGPCIARLLDGSKDAATAPPGPHKAASTGP